MQKIYVTTEFLCNKYGVSKQAVSKWRKDGMPHADYSERMKMYDENLVDKWLKSRPRNKK